MHRVKTMKPIVLKVMLETYDDLEKSHKDEAVINKNIIQTKKLQFLLEHIKRTTYEDWAPIAREMQYIANRILKGELG